MSTSTPANAMPAPPAPPALPLPLPPVAVEVPSLEEGHVTTRAIYTRQGVMLLSPGTALTRSVLNALSEIEDTDLYEADSAEQLRAAPTVGTEPLTPPRHSRRPLAVRIREAINTINAQRDQDTPSPFEFQPLDIEDEHQALRNRARLLKDAEHIVERHQRVWQHTERRVMPLAPQFGRTLSRGYAWLQPGQVNTLRTELIDAFRPHFAKLGAGLDAGFDDLLTLTDTLLEWYDRHPDRFAQLLHAPSLDAADLPAHALLTGAACIAISTRLAWSRDDIRLAGIAGFVADAGMVMVPSEVRRSIHPLDALGASRVLRHTAHTVALLEPSEMPAIVNLAAYQHHERLDGSGYPNYTPAEEICDHARVLSVADAYVASVSPRTYRPARRPYEAMEEIILLASQDKLDRRAVRALTEVAGLFPVGGYVRLTDGTAARVIGVDPERVDRPFVETVDTPDPRIIALSEHDLSEISIRFAIDPPLSVRRERPA